MARYWLFVLLVVVTAVIIVIQHFTIGRWWKGNELARRTVGLATVLLITATFIPLGLVQPETWFVFVLVIGTSGATLSALVIHENEMKRKEQARLEIQRGEKYAREITE